MSRGWRYRVTAIVGTVVLSASVVGLVNNARVLKVASQVPVLTRLPARIPQGSELYIEVLTATVVFTVAMYPMYKPRPRRILDTVGACQRRVLVGTLFLATIGYFDYTYRLPRLTVLLATPLLLVGLPAWFVWIRRHPEAGSSRAIVVGNDPEQIRSVASEIETPIIGYLAPMEAFPIGGEMVRVSADGGPERLGGLSRIHDVLIDYDVDTAILAFELADRSEFFGALDACYEHGVAAKVHRAQTDSVLTAERAGGTFVDVEVQPWDVQDYLVKRTFDVLFSAAVLLAATPVILAISIAIKLDDGGPILFRQERTAAFGQVFTLYKFRTMVADRRPLEPFEGNDERITRVGRVLRKTHLDELPQLWSVLTGEMSVVGPRAAWVDEEQVVERESDAWRKRWFVKPGLTGLAQINHVGSQSPDEKVRYDLEYIRNQSLFLDVQIVVRQMWLVMSSCASLVSGRSNGRRL